jgi:predicted ATPase/class 3 adenylate cyclase
MPPSGTVTFAFTDIEGSTQRWDRDRPAMEHAVRRHDEIMHAAIGEHRGHAFKTIGDAFCAAFERPEDAIAAMLAAQRRLADEDFSAVDGIRVRAAIHTGTADVRDGDYVGPALDRIARLVAIANGGQIVVSGVTSDLVHDALPAGVTLRDCGQHRLRDLTRPERVYQLITPGLRDDVSALRSLSTLPNNLPRMLNAFVGREREVDEITALVHANPLVTLVGSGGLGKTRISLQVAAQLLDGSGDGVWFIELAPLTSGDYIPSTIAHILGVVLPADGDPVDHLVRALKAKHLLLILDNCEHLIAPVARIVSALLRGCPTLSVLASSRQALGVAGESTYRMPTLSVPTGAQAATLTAADAPTYAAIALFVERTRAVDQRFVLTDENTPIVADICRRLDGIALAIELAASRVKILTPRQLRDRLDERFRVLTGGSRDLLPRQQTLRALIDWSHDLLDERERMLFRRLSIFVNGFTLEAAAAVAADEKLDAFEVIDLLESLVDKSLLIAESDGTVKRYRLLESTRAYALEKLDAAGERALLSARHLHHLRRRFAELAKDEARTGRQGQRYAEFVAEIEDVRGALGWALANDHVNDGAQLLVDLRRTWVEHGLEMESVAWHEAYLAALEPDAVALLAHLSIDLALVVVNEGSTARMRELAAPAVAHARASGDPTALVRALYVLAWVHLHEGNIEEADRAISEAEAIPHPAVSDRLYVIEARAHLCCLQGDYETAVRVFTQIRREHRMLGNANEELRTALNLANAEHNRGESRRAIEIAREILPEVRRDPDKTHAHGLCNLASALLAVDDVLAGAEIAREAITLLGADQPRHRCVSLAVEDLALAYAIIGKLERAALLVAYSDVALREIGYTREVGEQRGYQRLTALLHAGLAPGEIERISAQGRALAPTAAFAIAVEDDIPHHERTRFAVDQRPA